MPPVGDTLPAAAPQGRLAAEAEAHARNLADLERHLKEVCSQAGITPADGEDLLGICHLAAS